MVETPEQDRLDKRLEVSGVGRRFGEGEDDREGMCVTEKSSSVLMAEFRVVRRGNCKGNCKGNTTSEAREGKVGGRLSRRQNCSRLEC